jgi:3-phenylpropionate/trans-cinnamate dioxygenase ferredoxin subunit
VAGTLTVCPSDELPPGSRRIVRDGEREIGVFNVDGSYYALRNRCPHMAAPLCVGRVGGVLTSDGPHTYRMDTETLVVACPWHHWEYRLDDGRGIADTAAVRAYPVTVEDGQVTVHLTRTAALAPPDSSEGTLA